MGIYSGSECINGMSLEEFLVEIYGYSHFIVRGHEKGVPGVTPQTKVIVFYCSFYPPAIILNIIWCE